MIICRSPNINVNLKCIANYKIMLRTQIKKNIFKQHIYKYTLIQSKSLNSATGKKSFDSVFIIKVYFYYEQASRLLCLKIFSIILQNK